MNMTRCLKWCGRVLQMVFLIPAILPAGMACGAEEPAAAVTNRSVFILPALQAQVTIMDAEMVRLLHAGLCAEAEQLGAKIIETIPELPTAYYNVACAQALQGKTEAALESLNQAVQHGFNAVNAAKRDPDLENLRKHKDWKKILRAMDAAAPLKPETRKVAATTVTNGVALVSESNTAWNGALGVLQSFFVLPEGGGKDKAPVAGNETLRLWHKEGTAAGLYGDLYDNRDGGHSEIGRGSYPQLAWVQYAPEANTNGINRGLQLQLFFNKITIGNASVANTSGRYWRSMPRQAYPDGRAMTLLYLQYISSHIYFYPEHRDYDPGHNGQDGGGHGDVYCGNSPYLVISQGSSGSDRAFMDAVLVTLASFRPEVKEFLAKRGALMPAVQMIMRSCAKTVVTPEDYLTGKAHPPVFEGGNLNARKMSEMAHEMKLETLPPQIFLKVEDEDKPVAGRDYFDPRPSESLYETPAAIGRVVRSMQYQRRMVVSAAESKDFKDAPLTYHWRVLRGDPSRIQIKPLNKTGSRVELLVSYHERFPVEPGSAMEGNRVDIGAFINNGKYYSAPAFVSFFYLDNEKRVYGAKHEILSVQYSGANTPGNYVDPMIDIPKDWLDEYRYDGEGSLTGWTRTLGAEKQDFTAEGRLVVGRDASGKPTETQSMVYGVKRVNGDKLIIDCKSSAKEAKSVGVSGRSVNEANSLSMTSRTAARVGQ